MAATGTAPCDRWGEDGPFIREILGRISAKWTVLIIGTLATGPLRYSELLARIPGISQRMLTVTVKELQRDGIVTRTAYPEVPPRVEYELTPLGASLLSIVLGMAEWAAEHQDEIRANRARFPAKALADADVGADREPVRR
ncbi:MAG: helix-turn-helix domain-containing protein [Mycobacterium sp.]